LKSPSPYGAFDAVGGKLVNIASRIKALVIIADDPQPHTTTVRG
jgi:hypothetical protein